MDGQTAQAGLNEILQAADRYGIGLIVTGTAIWAVVYIVKACFAKGGYAGQAIEYIGDAIRSHISFLKSVEEVNRDNTEVKRRLAESHEAMAASMQLVAQGVVDLRERGEQRDQLMKRCIMHNCDIAEDFARKLNVPKESIAAVTKLRDEVGLMLS